MLAWMAASTTRIAVASRVLGVPYRAPAMVAKMAETLDRLSGRQLILWLGGGYSDDEFRAFGLGVPTPREKVDGLGEAVAHHPWSLVRTALQLRWPATSHP
jgi:alkanesulfonate monooxygenase SsuD/methylene tetrahydromethanopterin reductase-like flavin-dependent oxidoreductase (luciferase family)